MHFYSAVCLRILLRILSDANCAVSLSACLIKLKLVADTEVRDVRGLATGTKPTVSTQGDLEAPTMSGGDIHCSCLKCRRAIPSVRGQAVPRY